MHLSGIKRAELRALHFEESRNLIIDRMHVCDETFDTRTREFTSRNDRGKRGGD